MTTASVPVELQAQQAVVACLMTTERDRAPIFELVDEEMFTQGNLRTAFQVLGGLFLKGDQIDRLTFSNALRKFCREDSALYSTTVSWVADSVEKVPITEGGEYYATIVREGALRRRIVSTLEDALREMRDPKTNPAAIFEIYDKLTRHALPDTKNLWEVRELLGDFSPDVHKKSLLERGLPSCGIFAVDEAIPIFKPTKLTCLAGRPGAGKSTLMRQMILSASLSGPVLVFSLEESKEIMRDKMLCSLARVNYDVWYRGKTTAEEDTRLILTMGVLAERPIVFYGNFLLEAAHVRLNVKRLAAEGRKPRAIFVDHLQLMKHSKADSRNEAIGETTRTLKLLAMEMDLPIVVLSQMNRGQENREDPQPRLSDLRESGSIEADCDNVIFIWRARDAQPTEAVLTIAKQRDGPTSVKDLVFVRQLGRFEAAANQGGA